MQKHERDSTPLELTKEYREHFVYIVEEQQYVTSKQQQAESVEPRIEESEPSFEIQQGRAIDEAMGDVDFEMRDCGHCHRLKE